MSINNIPIPILNYERLLSNNFNPKYISHRTPNITNYSDWHDAYHIQLVQMYIITQNILKSRYPKNKFPIECNTSFNKFSKLIYQCSSKHIDMYLN